ncbi:hypothetical protein F4778DRAFT_721531 [Xylariomycetidae sp. FL2044]|nr:hypothetical protein F4778DRAFT_721531 [Xylariomycetidae sp. FL2044]
MPPAILTALYPQGTKIDMDYYLTKHFPMVQKLWVAYGLKSWKVITYGEDATFCLQAVVEFESAEGLTAAMSSSEKDRFVDDVKNFADHNPEFMIGGTAREEVLR